MVNRVLEVPVTTARSLQVSHARSLWRQGQQLYILRGFCAYVRRHLFIEFNLLWHHNTH